MLEKSIKSLLAGEENEYKKLFIRAEMDIPYKVRLNIKHV